MKEWIMIRMMMIIAMTMTMMITMTMTMTTTMTISSLPEGRSLLALTSPGDEMSDITQFAVCSCLCHRHILVSNLFRGTAQLLEVDLNLRSSCYKAPNIPLHHRATHYNYVIVIV